MPQQPPFVFEAPPIAGQRPVGAHRAMTWDHERQRIGGADRARRVGTSWAPRDLAIGARLAPPNRAECLGWLRRPARMSNASPCAVAACSSKTQLNRVRAQLEAASRKKTLVDFDLRCRERQASLRKNYRRAWIVRI